MIYMPRGYGATNLISFIIEIIFSEDELVLKVESCPAVRHMRKGGYPVARLFYETINTVNQTLCEGTPFAAELVEYDQETGGGTQRFYRKAI